jgi:hypothetical protein
MQRRTTRNSTRFNHFPDLFDDLQGIVNEFMNPTHANWSSSQLRDCRTFFQAASPFTRRQLETNREIQEQFKQAIVRHADRLLRVPLNLYFRLEDEHRHLVLFTISDVDRSVDTYGVTGTPADFQFLTRMCMKLRRAYNRLRRAQEQMHILLGALEYYKQHGRRIGRAYGTATLRLRDATNYWMVDRSTPHDAMLIFTRQYKKLDEDHPGFPGQKTRLDVAIEDIRACVQHDDPLLRRLRW